MNNKILLLLGCAAFCMASSMHGVFTWLPWTKPPVVENLDTTQSVNSDVEKTVTTFISNKQQDPLSWHDYELWYKLFLAKLSKDFVELNDTLVDEKLEGWTLKSNATALPCFGNFYTGQINEGVINKVLRIFEKQPHYLLLDEQIVNEHKELLQQGYTVPTDKKVDEKNNISIMSAPLKNLTYPKDFSTDIKTTTINVKIKYDFACWCSTLKNGLQVQDLSLEEMQQLYDVFRKDTACLLVQGMQYTQKYDLHKAGAALVFGDSQMAIIPFCCAETDEVRMELIKESVRAIQNSPIQAANVLVYTFSKYKNDLMTLGFIECAKALKCHFIKKK